MALKALVAVRRHSEALALWAAALSPHSALSAPMRGGSFHHSSHSVPSAVLSGTASAALATMERKVGLLPMAEPAAAPAVEWVDEALSQQALASLRLWLAPTSKVWTRAKVHHSHGRTTQRLHLDGGFAHSCSVRSPPVVSSVRF